MFEITPEDIARLDDTNLRAVIARLCEAELRKRGLSASYVTWGGDQNAKDGGIDVRVALPPGAAIDGFVPRAATGFQAKAQDMPRTEILDEMRPKDVIRPAIQELADQSGAYIIVSSEGSTADLALTNRRDAMKEAMASVQHGDALTLDFYDRTRVATWVRSHEGLIPWVRSLVGRAIQGWQSYGSWTYTPTAAAAEYLFDEKLRIHPAKRVTENGLSALHGIEQMRDELRDPRHIVRLVGLSGVGKTRLVQALFDEQVAERSLDPSLAIYTNMADNPDPQPIGFASNLVTSGCRVILVVDNCPPELHQRLSELCRRPESKVSVITVEYDIREDEPEGTEVFTLEASSSGLIAQLIGKRFPDLSQIDARTIAEFSGGNARIAIALAATVGHKETIAGLTDEELFQRLFHQRHAPNESLYLAAQACSLVYSFQGEDVSDAPGAELIRLGKLCGKPSQELHYSVAELQRRGLVQQRGVWRAVLPHAIANRLAKVALQNIPYSMIEEQLFTEPSGRLLKSFSRRLSYLDDSKQGVQIVTQWLGIGGMLQNVASLHDLGRAMFENVAPVAPEAIVAALERAVFGPQGEEAAKACKDYLDLLRSVAYDPALFERCTALMVAILIANDMDERAHGAQLFASLFHLCLSGTHATIEQRLKVIDALLSSPEEKRRSLGVLALHGVLEAWHFQSSSTFEFGARSRDFGYWPRSDAEVRHWFTLTLALVAKFSCSDAPAAPHARVAFAEKFYGLWHRGGVPGEIAEVCGAIRQYRFWPEGWLAVRQTLDFDGKGMIPESIARLKAIEAQLRPKDLLQQVRSVVFSTRLQGVDLDDFEDDNNDDVEARMARSGALARDLGKTVASDEAALQELLPELVRNEGVRLWQFGQGLLDGAGDAQMMWDRLVAALGATQEGSRRPQVVGGFLHELHATNLALAAELLDNAVEDETLAVWYPYLQVAFDIGADDIVRLKHSLAIAKAPARMYIYLAQGRATDPVPAGELKELALGIAALPDGYAVAVEILGMRLHAEEQRKQGIPGELVVAGWELLKQCAFTGRDSHHDYMLSAIAKSCLQGPTGAALTMELLRNLKEAVAKHATSAYDHDDLLVALFSVQPAAALDGLLAAGDAKELGRGMRVLRDVGIRKHPIAVVPEDVLLLWCDQEPQTRYPAIAQVITVYQRKDDKSPPHWTRIALRFLERAPEPREILKQFVGSFTPSGGWTGSLAAILESNAVLLDQLGAYPELSDAIVQEKQALREWIDKEKCRETARDRDRDEYFE